MAQSGPGPTLVGEGGNGALTSSPTPPNTAVAITGIAGGSGLFILGASPNGFQGLGGSSASGGGNHLHAVAYQAPDGTDEPGANGSFVGAGGNGAISLVTPNTPGGGGAAGQIVVYAFGT